MKLNFGSAHDNLGGDWKNVDGLDWDGNTDVIWNMNNFPYPFESGTIEEIRSVENLEHISWKRTHQVLKEFNKLLVPGGALHIQVPDCGKMMEYYVKHQICHCVPHKATKGEFRADPDCFKCSGQGKVNPQRWLLSFVGAQKHEFDAHLAIFTERRLLNELKEAGFVDIKFKPDINKLKVNCKKPI